MPLPRDKYNSPTDYEKKLSQKIKGSKAEVGSGAFSGDYDVTKRQGGDAVMIDAKRTDKKSFSINIEKFKAIERRSNLEQIPCITINFNEYGKSLAVIREEDFLDYLEMLAYGE